MRMSLLCSVAAVFLVTGAAFAQNEGEFPATLKGHAVLPAQSFIDAPADAPNDLKTSGKYTTGRRVDALTLPIPFGCQCLGNRADRHRQCLSRRRFHKPPVEEESETALVVTGGCLFVEPARPLGPRAAACYLHRIYRLVAHGRPQSRRPFTVRASRWSL